ncbi:hypothetical protein MKW94_009877, partial [Papaver nudicaule]|nr:hypothetical protein [Papaver nudicaule]
MSCRKEISKKKRRRKNNKKSSIVNPIPVVNVDCGKKYHGVVQRSCGKWAAEIQLPTLRLKVLLGTFDTAEEASMVYERETIRSRCPNGTPCFGTKLEPEALIADSPLEGNERAVLASYRDCYSQVSLAHSKEIGMDTETDLWSDISILPEFVYSDGPCFSIDEVNTSATESSENVTHFPKLPPVAASTSELPPDVTYSTKMAQVASYTAKISPVAISPKMQPASNYSFGQATCSQENLFREVSEYFRGSLPSSFTAQLPICSSEVQK